MPEIVLGGRRGRARKVLRPLVALTLLVVIAGTIGAIWLQRTTTYPVPAGDEPDAVLEAVAGRLRWTDASLEQRGTIAVLRLAGAPRHLGVARGRLLAARASSSSASFDAAILGERPPSGLVAGPLASARLRWRLRLLGDGLPDWARAELAGLVEGLHESQLDGAPSYQDVVRRSAALDLGAAPDAELPIGGMTAGFAVVRATAGGTPLVARALSLPGASGATAPDLVVTFARPAGKLAWAGVGWPDGIGVVTGINAERLAIIVNPAVADDVRPAQSAAPLAIVARGVLESARTLDEAIARLRDTPSLGAGSVLLVDGKSNTWAVVERSPGRVAVRRPASAGGPLWIDDLLVAPEFSKDAENDRARRAHARASRGGRLASLAGRGAATLADMIALLRDRRAGERTLPLGHRNALDDVTAQHVVVIDPARGLLWVGEGPGAAGGFVVFDLTAELTDAPPRVLAPEEAQIAAEADVSRADLERVTLAHGLTRDAARLLRAGRTDAARDALTRALALAPELPPAWRLLGRLERDAGRGTAARAAFEAYLAREPSDPAGLEEARSFLAGP